MDFLFAGDAVKQLVYSIAGEKYKDLVTIKFNWEKIVGKLLAERTNLKKLQHQTLFVGVTNNVWLQELVLRKQQIIEDVRLMLDISLKDIVFTLQRGKKWQK
jgi:predicted nucleic acid-binding Zn ribbon protein